MFLQAQKDAPQSQQESGDLGDKSHDLQVSCDQGDVSQELSDQGDQSHDPPELDIPEAPAADTQENKLYNLFAICVSCHVTLCLSHVICACLSYSVMLE